MTEPVIMLITGAGLTLVGSVVTQFVTHRLKARTDKRALLGQKFEALVEAVYEHDRWVNAFVESRAFDGEKESGTSPFAKIYAIATVHFPDLLPKLKALDQTAQPLKLWALKAGQDRILGDLTAASNGSVEAASEFVKCQVELLDYLRSYAERHFN